MRFAAQLRVQSLVVAVRVEEDDFAKRRRQGLKRVDRELSKGNFKTALSLLKQLQGKPGGLRGFGAAKQVPRRISTLEELELENSEIVPQLRPLFGLVMDSIEECVGFSLAESAVDDDDEGREYIYEEYIFSCLQHEAGHFLVGYLLGALPREYRIPSMEDLRNGSGGIVNFWGIRFLRQIGAAKAGNKKSIKKGICERALNQLSSIRLGGLVAEQLTFGRSEGHRSDVDKMYRIFNLLGFSEIEANSRMRWAALNTLCILHRHHEARLRLVDAMAKGKSVGLCIDAIENAIDGKEI